MSTQTTNRISVDVTEQLVTDCADLLHSLSSNLDFVIGLTPAERVALPKINVSNKVFVEDAYRVAMNNTEVLPGYLKMEEMRKDMEGYSRLDELVLQVSQLAEKLRDTQLLMGSEAYVTALTVYRLMESAARDGVPGTEAGYRLLAERFKGQGNFSNGEDDTDNGDGTNNTNTDGGGDNQ